jgi:hypothetical protein
MPRRRDPVLAALDDLCAAIEANTRSNERILARAENIRLAREAGTSYRDIVSDEERPLIPELVTENLERLFRAGSRLRRAEAAALHDEGVSMEKIGTLFGVTRQRVSALLRPDRQNAPSPTSASA